MSPVLIFSFITTLIFGSLAIFLSFKEERTRKNFEEQKKELSRKFYEVLVLKQLSEEIGYSLNLRKVVETIVSTVENLFDLSTVSYALVDERKILVKTYVKEKVGSEYVKQIQKILLDSIYTIDEKAKEQKVFNFTQGEMLDYDQKMPLSYFNIPLVISNEFVGLINISSSIKNLYQEKDMSIFYKIVSRALSALERLEALIETEKGKLNALITSLPAGSILFSLEYGQFKLSNINNAAKEFLRIKQEADETNVLSSFSTQPNFIQTLKDVANEKKSVILKDTHINEKFFKIYINPIFLHESERVIGISITMQDITLENEIQKMRENFTNMVVHELRAPLTSIKGASELLITKKLKKEEKDKMLHVINESSIRMLGDIGDLLDAAKIEAGHFDIVREISDINLLVKQKAEAFSYLAGTKGVNIKVKVDENIPKFDFDNIRIGQVINNLVSNSIKFTRQGGSIDILTALEGQNVKVAVHDTGVGISAQEMPFLFSKFGQIQDGFKRGGTGLGLYISKGVVESHGGKIWIESEEGNGTTVCFNIPIVRDEKVVKNEIPYSSVVNKVLN